MVGSDSMCVVKEEEMMTTTNVREEDSLDHGGFRFHVCCKRGRNDDND